MKKINFFVKILALVLITIAASANAKIIDVWPGQSLQEVINSAKPGDTVIIHGEFNEAVDVHVSGVEGHPIKIIGDNAVIKGNNISRDGFVFRPNSSYIVLESLRIKNFSSNWGLALYGNNTHIHISNVEIDHCETGIHLTAGYSGQEPMFGAVWDVSFESVNVHDNKVGGLDCTPGPCYNLTITNSSFHDNGIQGFGADGIAVEIGNNILIKNVTVFGNGGDGIDLCSRNPLFIENSANVTVRECTIANNGMQGLKLWNGGKAINCLIHSNGLEGLVIVYNGNYVIQHCDVVKNALQGGYAFTAGYPEINPLGKQDELNVIIQNSIFAFNGNLTKNNPTGIWIAYSKSFTTQNSIYFNRDFEEIYFNDTGESITRDQINMNLLGVNFGVDPKFVNMNENDFHLKPMSPAIDNGTIVEIKTDLDCNPRPIGEGYDIGCYEFTPNSYNFLFNISITKILKLFL